jgi:hypothetical protein
MSRHFICTFKNYFGGKEMNIDLSKYLTNKDVTISNNDFDMETLKKDVYNGYTKNEDIKPPKDMVSKADFDKLQSDYSTLEASYTNQTKVLSETNDKMARVSLESKLVRKGFDEKDFDEVVKLRTSLYGDEKDDQKAVDSIAEKFKDTYFKKQEPTFNKAPNEGGLKAGNQQDSGKRIEVTRKTSIKDLIIPVTK